MKERNSVVGLDVPGHSWSGCGCDAGNMFLGRDVPDHSYLGCGSNAANMCFGRDVLGQSWSDVAGLLPS